MTVAPALLLDAVCAIARQAAEAILAVYAQDFDIVCKDDNSPVTAADLAAQRVIEEGLRELTPHVPVISEEAVAAPWAERRTWRRYWLVDPLDGTREFVKRNGEFTVNIALVEDHRSILGVVLAPVTGDLYAAGFLFGYTQGRNLEDCGRIASLCAGEIISHFGARPEVPLTELLLQNV